MSLAEGGVGCLSTTLWQALALGSVQGPHLACDDSGAQQEGLFVAQTSLSHPWFIALGLAF